MKIVVTTEQTSTGELHHIEVMDGKKIVHVQVADTMKQRDAIVWKLAELYHVVDIDLQQQKQNTKRKKDFKYSEIPSIPVVDQEDATAWFDDEGDRVFARIVEAISEGVTMSLDSIRLFELNGTGAYLTAERPHWKEGLQRALHFFVHIERYDKCIEIRELIKKL